jgi:type I restriction enzyme S subunit
MPKVNQCTLLKLPIPLPPLAEQNRIVAKVEELMTLCDRLEVQLANAKTETSGLLESVLHHALKETEEEVVPPVVPTIVAAVSSLR